MNTVFRKAMVGGALVAATLTGGAIGAALINGSASAATATTAPTTSSSDSSAPTAAAPRPAGPHVANGITETPLTGDDLAKATAAANKAVPGGTIERAETDADGAVYEVHMTNASGERVTVLMDKDFNVSSVEQGGGMGHGHGAAAPSGSTQAG